MHKCINKISMLVTTVILLLGMCLAVPTTTYAAKEKVKRKYIAIELKDIQQQGEDGLFSGTLTWEPMKGCSDYEVYRSCDDGEKELIATTSNGVCQCAERDLGYSKHYRYTIYGFRQSDGTLVKGYYAESDKYIDLPKVFRPNLSMNEMVTTPNKVQITLGIPDYSHVLKPEYLEVTRRNIETDKTKKFKIAWADFEETRALRNPEPSAYTTVESAIFTDDTVKPGNYYEYSFRTSCTINGEKIYSQINSYRLSSYNGEPIFGVDITTKTGKKASTITIKFKSQKGNAPIVINNKILSKHLNIWAPATDYRKYNYQPSFSEISYDGKNWFKVKDSLYIILEEEETIYLKFKVKSDETLNVSDKKTKFKMFIQILYYPDRGINSNWGYYLSFQGDLTHKTYKKYVAESSNEY